MRLAGQSAFYVRICFSLADMPFRSINTERSRLHRDTPSKRCDILIATPGRLIDHIENYGLKDRFSGLR